MLDQLWTFVQHQLATNNFLSGGAFLMVVGALGAACRSYPERWWTWFKCRFIIEVDILDRDPCFNWVNQWLAKHPYSTNRARLLTVSTVRKGYSNGPSSQDDDDCDESRPRIIFSPAPGRHYFFYRWRLVILQRERKDKANAQEAFGIHESFVLKVFTRDRGIIEALLEEARDLVVPPDDDRLEIMTARYGSWNSALKRRPRSLESVMLPEGIMESLLADIQAFQHREQWYVDRGLPYRRGYLLEGPPGSGKSSSVLAIASHLGLDIAILNLNGSGMDDDNISELLARVPERSILLIEDVDCVFKKREAEKDKDNRLTFSGLLNALDGVAASEGRILFMNTNHPERLDPALIRPGRADVHFHIGNADRYQIGRIFKRFFPEADDATTETWCNSVEPGCISMATLQGHLVKYSSSPLAAIEHCDEFTNPGARQYESPPPDQAEE